MSNTWQIWVDTGGTFTDCIGIDPDGKRLRTKVLSKGSLRGKVVKVYDDGSFLVQADWADLDIFSGYRITLTGEEQSSGSIREIKDHRIFLDQPISGLLEGKNIEISSGEEAPILATRVLTGTALGFDFPPIDIKIGSTKGTNALLERKGARTALLITKGYKDLLEIGTQQRPHIFQLAIQKDSPIYHCVLEVNERLDKDGKTLEALSAEEILDELNDHNIDSVAIALLHSYRNPKHENQLKIMLEENGYKYVSTSSELYPGIKILERAQTAVVNAYLSPVIRDYLEGIRPFFNENAFRVMSSAGGLFLPDHFHAKDSLFSGPAGGVIGAVNKAKSSGLDKIITFDMGGTSTDVAIYNQAFDYSFETHIDQIQISSPTLSISTVAAGGGSVCAFDGLRFTAGPESAGASPGPACYGAGGPLTITDVNLLLGYIDPSNFKIPLDISKAKEAFSKISDDNQQALLEGFREIANQKMAEAIRKISISKGKDPSEYTLVAFGGAGGQHVCSVAEQLGMHRIMIPSEAGLLSAYGIGQAKVERFTTHQVLESLDRFKVGLDSFLDQHCRETLDMMIEEGFHEEEIEISRILCYLRFTGQDHSIELDYIQEKDLFTSFQRKYNELYGHFPQQHRIEIESIKILASTYEKPVSISTLTVEYYRPEHIKKISGVFSQEEIPVYQDLSPGAKISGPALILDEHSTTYLEPSWELEMDGNYSLIMNRTEKSDSKGSESKPEELQLELYTNRFKSIAEDMGALLQHTSFSVNIKERLDFSCAVMDNMGDLIVNAPHIPVHLGGMGLCVKSVASHMEMEEGDVIITNHPGYGGSHLPDITLIAPVYFEDSLVGYVSNRAHHAELGGKRPGSMPPDAISLEEEGVVISPEYLVKKGVADWNNIEDILSSSPYPTRAPEENLADLNAALASIRLGVERLQSLCLKHGVINVLKYMNGLKEYSASALEQAIMPFNGHSFSAIEALDDGSKVKVQFEVKRAGILIDFEGTSKSHPGNLNATPAIVHSAVIYVLRLLVNEDIPLNEGLMDKVRINLPRCFLNPDFPEDHSKCPPVVGGNTETSQRLVDTLIKALGIAACSQGTMNNFLFGDENFGYYETIGGGSGASDGHDGKDAIHQHMTNTKITDPEILEFRYPVRLNEFSIRKDSGGAGKWKGGNGIKRIFEFQKDLEVTLLSQHRNEEPYGMKGGGPALRGNQFVLKRNGDKIKLAGVSSLNVEKEDKFVILTPGGGGFGS